MDRDDSDKLIFDTTTTGNVMAILTGGNVGIGTTSPDSLLELSSGATNLIIRSTTSTASASIDFQPAGGASSRNPGKFTIRAGGQGGAYERLDFMNGDGTKLVTIASTGNVGIGTTGTSTNKLVDVGVIRLGTSGTNGCVERFD